MSAKTLRVFERLPIPVEFAATMKYALLAKSNGGKTYTTLKFEEQACDAGMFFVTLDPVGKHWALRVGENGDPAGGKPDVWVLGGLHGDVPLEPTSGALIADTVIEHPGRYVLDLSTFETDAEQDRFAYEFARRLFRRKAKDPGFPLLLILEEAESFIPQQPRQNQAQMLGAFARIARQGRNHGLGLWMVAQRSAALNKGVLSQADVLIAKEMSHKRDRDAVDDWVEANGTREQRDELMGSLASLAVNEAWVWSPSWLGTFKRARVLPRETFDSSRSAAHGDAIKRVELRPLDVGALGQAIAATAEKAKADDPRALRRQIAELERAVREAEAAPAASFSAEEYAQLIADLEGADKEADDAVGGVVLVEEATSEVLSERLRDQLEGTREHIIDGRRYLQRAHDTVAGWSAAPTATALAAARKQSVPGLRTDDDALQRASSARKGVQSTAAPSRPAQRRRAPDSGSNGGARAPSRRSSGSGNAVDAGSARERPASSNGDEPQLKAGARRILEEMARVHPLRLTRSQVGLATGLKITGGTFGTYWGVLKRSGYVDEDGRDAGVTDAGLERAGVEPGHAASPDEIREMWRSKLKRGARDMLDLLVERHPEGYSKEQLADLLDMAVSGGTFGTYLGTLRRNGLAVVDGDCYASDDLFVGA